MITGRKSGGGGKRFQPCRQPTVVSSPSNPVILTKPEIRIEQALLLGHGALERRIFEAPAE
jgi:hypothetical protein